MAIGVHSIDWETRRGYRKTKLPRSGFNAAKGKLRHG